MGALRAGARTRTLRTRGSSPATRRSTPLLGELLLVLAPSTSPTRCSTRAGTAAARGTATTRAPTPTTGSSATPTSTTGSLDSLEDSPLPPSLRTPVSPQTVGEQQLWVNNSLVNCNFCKRNLCLIKHHVDLPFVQKLF